jgi:hypothetical protein
VVKEDDFNQVFVRVNEIRTAAKTVQAKIAVHQRMANAGIKEKAYLCKAGDSLQTKADVPRRVGDVTERRMKTFVNQKLHFRPVVERLCRVARIGFCFAQGRETGRPRRGKAWM